VLLLQKVPPRPLQKALLPKRKKARSNFIDIQQTKILPVIDREDFLFLPYQRYESLQLHKHRKLQAFGEI
jgi:hypothetical protein